MTGVERIGRPALQRATGRSLTRGGFVVPGGAGQTGSAAASAPTEAVALTSMLSLQEFGDEEAQDRKARQHGHDMLAALADLQRALLAGEDDAAALHRLANLADAVPASTDRRLMAMISAIVLRARVELARRQP